VYKKAGETRLFYVGPVNANFVSAAESHWAQGKEEGVPHSDSMQETDDAAMRPMAPAPSGCRLKNCHAALLLPYLEQLNLVSRA
jgi:hypothetical protein